MNLDEVIVVDSIPQDAYNKVVQKSLEYAILSIPFTINRMGIDFIEPRVVNIFKGKLAEGLFEYFCLCNEIPVDTDSCTTPFWMIDKKDFILNDLAWDIKNNYIYLDPSKKIDFTKLPALIPNRHSNDQWSKRTAFVFSFIKWSELINGKRKEPFLKLCFNEHQIIFLDKLYRKYSGLPIKKEPFDRSEYVDHFKGLSKKPLFELSYRPKMYITAIAKSKDWDLFLDTGKRSPDHYRDFDEPEWYTRYRSGSISFLDGTLWGTITNKTTPIAMLDSFSGYIGKKEFKYGRLLDGE